MSLHVRTLAPPGRQRGSVLGVLFALVFIAAGLAAGAFFAWGLVDWFAARSWQPVEARLLSVDLATVSDTDGGTTDRVEAEYAYSFDGRRYVGDRVGLHTGADNIGDWHQRTHARLDRALNASEPVTAWVDPDDPGRAVLDRNARWGLLAFGMIFPVVFGGVGVLVLWLLVRGRRETRERERLGDAEPDRPWLWEDRWRSTELRSRASTTTMCIAIGFAGLWNLISLPVLFIVPGEVADGNTPALIGLLFPAVGIGLLVWAVREVIRRRRYGDSVLRLDALPVPLGGRLAATLEVPARLTDRDLDVQLACVHRYRTGTGKNRRTREETLWEDKQLVDARSGSAPGSTAARIEMQLPYDQPVSRARPVSDRIVWQLTAAAAEPGVDYRATFELPVFETEATEAARADPRTFEDRALAGEDWRETGVVHGLASGGQRFFFPRFRLAGAGVVVALIALLFGGAGAFLMLGEQQWIFGGIFVAVGGLIAAGAVSMAFQRSEIVVGLDRLRWRHGVFGDWQEIDAGAIRAIDVKKSGSIGRNLHYKLVMERLGGDGSRITIADWVPGQRPAQALARKIAGLAGVQGGPD